MAYNWKKFMHGLENYGLAVADGSLSALGATNVIKPEMYIGENKDKWAKAGDIYGGVTQAVLPLALNIVAPGSGAIASTVQKGVSAATNPNNTDPNKAAALGGAAANAYGQYQDFQGTQQLMNSLDVLKNLSSMPMAFGGMNPQSGVELEKQEVYRTPQGQIRQVDAPTHAQGGTGPMMLPNKTNVLSDRLKTTRGKTFAEEGAQYDTSKWEKILQTTTDPYKKKTAERMIEASNKKLSKLYAEQELAKGNETAKGIGTMQSEEMKNGGTINFKSADAYKAWLGYGHATGVFENTPGNQNVSIKGQHKNVEHMPGGGLYDVPNYDPNQPIPTYYTLGPNDIYPAQPTDFWSEAYGQRGEGNMIPVADNQNPQFQSLPSKTINQLPTNYTTPTINPNIQTLPPYTPQDPSALDKFKTGAQNVANKVGDQLSQVNPYFSLATFGNSLGSIYDIYRGAKGPDEVNFDRIKPELVDYSKARRMAVQEANRGFNATENYVKNATAGNAGAYLANIGAANAARDRMNSNTISQSIENENNMNSQIKNAVNGSNAQIQMQESVARQQEKDIAKNTLATGLYNFGAALNQYGNDMQLKGNEPVLKALISTGDYDYVYDKRGKPMGITYKGTGKTTWFTQLSKQQLKEKEALEANLPK